MKNLRRFILILLAFFPAILPAQSYSIVRKNYLSGVIDNTGKQIVPTQFANISIDPSGYFHAFNPGIFSLFDREGKILFTSPNYADVGYFGSGLLPVRDRTTGLWGYADLAGVIRIAPAYSDAKTFVNGLAVVYFSYSREEKDYHTKRAPRVIDLQGKIQLDFSSCPEIFQVDLYPFSDSLVSFIAQGSNLSGYMEQADNDVQGFINMRGELLTNTVRKTLHWLNEGFLQPGTESWMPYARPVAEDQYAYCAPDGRVIIPGPFNAAHPFSEDGIAMVHTGTDHFIDLTGKPLYDFSRYRLGEPMPGGFNLHPSYGSKRISVYDKQSKRFAYLDTKGRVAITLDSGLHAMDFCDGIAPIWRWIDEKQERYVWTWIDTTGKTLAPFDTLSGFLNPPRYRNVPFVFLDRVSFLYGVKYPGGKIVVAPQGTYISEKEGVFLVRWRPEQQLGPVTRFARSYDAFSYEGVLITDGFESFSEFTSFNKHPESAGRITAVNFTAKELGEMVIDALGIRESVDQMREYRKEQEKTEE